MTFFFFRCAANRSLIAVVADPSGRTLPTGQCYGERWEPLKEIAETGELRFAFSEELAKADIEKTGVSIIRMKTL